MELSDIDLNSFDLFVYGDRYAAWKVMRAGSASLEPQGRQRLLVNHPVSGRARHLPQSVYV